MAGAAASESARRSWPPAAVAVALSSAPDVASCGGQQTAEATPSSRVAPGASASGWFYHTVSTSTPTAKRQEEHLFQQAAGEREALQQPSQLPEKGRRGGVSLEETAQHPTPAAEANASASASDASSDADGQHDELVLSLSATRSQLYAWSAASSESRSVRFDSDGDSGSAHSTLQLERTRELGGSFQDSILARISTLRALCDEGFITEDEYERRKCAIVDELSFSSALPSSTQNTSTPRRRMCFRRSEGLPLIVPHAPDFSDVSPELATKHVFDYATRQWSTTQVCISLDETPFSKGSLRVVYHLQALGAAESAPPAASSYVAKLAIDPDEDPQTYFRDIELQAHCAHYAQVYNSYTPPKRVEFLPAWVLELPERGGVLCAVEHYIPGEYRKHNNNFGSVSDDERNTPQAFSHFTYEASNHELLAVDIQGVGDLYTDPQIHTLNGNDFGKGNLGVLGFHKFLSSHRCNSICRYLKLPPVNPKARHADYGTLPVQELMNRDRVRPTHFDSRHYYENAPMLQKYVTQCRELELELEHEHRGSAHARKRRHGSSASATPASNLMRCLRVLCCGKA